MSWHSHICKKLFSFALFIPWHAVIRKLYWDLCVYEIDSVKLSKHHDDILFAKKVNKIVENFKAFFQTASKL